MNRRTFIRGTGLLASGSFLSRPNWARAAPSFPTVRPAASLRRFQSQAVEAAISEFTKNVKDPELAWLFNNCFPNPLDTAVTPGTRAGRPDTFFITGAVDAMWLRDSTAQVWPYLALITRDAPLRQLVAGVINRQTRCILQDPYANAFYRAPTKVGEWHTNQTAMQPGVHERKWEIDSLCYPIRLGYHYWKITGDHQPFDAQWRQAIALTLQTFREQQHQTGPGPYRFFRQTTNPPDTPPLKPPPVHPTGLIASAFRPGDDATRYPFLVPGNFFAVTSLRQAFLMMADIAHDNKMAQECMALADEIAVALRQHALIQHPKFGPVFAYEVDGTGNYTLMDDANAPSLLALPYLDALPLNEPTYQNTRKLILSSTNPCFYQGTAAAGIGSPHTGPDMIWPIGLALRGLTSTDAAEIGTCIQVLKTCHGGTGFMHESFHKDDPTKYTRAWFAWANTLFGEFLWKVYRERPQLLG
jgi:meiotically up-regulated gene 157 (Mug157) protein